MKQGLKPVNVKRYCWTLLSVALVTGLGEIITPFFSVTTVALLYLLPVVLTAVYWGRGFSWLASFLGVLAFDIFFIPPYLSLTVADIKDLFTFAILLLVGLISGTIATRLREELEKTRAKERTLRTLYELDRQIAAQADLHGMLQTLAKTVSEIAGGEVSLLAADTGGRTLSEVACSHTSSEGSDKERAVVQWVLEHGQWAGKGTDTLRDASELVLPVMAENKALAALVIRSDREEENLSGDQLQLIEAFSDLAAIAIMRAKLAREAEQAQQLAESERLHRALLDSISHDLRTPLASVIGAVTGLLEEGSIYDQATTKVLLETIKRGAFDLDRLVANLLHMARMQAGTLSLIKEWCDIEDMVGVALKRARDISRGHQLLAHIPPALPPVMADFASIEDVVINLIQNAVKDSGPGAPISILARSTDKAILVTVADEGAPLPVYEREHLFERLYRTGRSAREDGTAIGLAVCKGIVEAHGGMIWLEPPDGTGNRFTFSLPLLPERFQGT